jgi:hypothetical protein
VTSAAKAALKKQGGYRSGKPLRHPKASASPVNRWATQKQVQCRFFREL